MLYSDAKRAAGRPVPALGRAADDDRERPLDRLRLRVAARQRVVLAVEVERLVFVQLPVDELELLAEALDAPGGRVELEAELLVLGVMPAGAHPQE